MKLRLLFAACLALAAGPIFAATTARPNVIVILTDDQGYGDLACHGNTMLRTPNLDRLHDDSVRFTNYHVDPTCAPTRSALMTGRYSTRVGVWHTIMGRSLLARDEVTMADVFKHAGYRTALFGKWHLGDNYPLRPQDRGFDETVAIGGGGIGQTPDSWGNDCFDDTYFHNGVPEQYSGYCTDVFFDRALDFIARSPQPFFVYLATNAPHAPYRVAEKYQRRYTEAGVPPPMDAFYGMIENLDENVGRLLSRLKELGLAENTVLIWTTDNGTPSGIDAAAKPGQWNGFNAGMRGKKSSEYEGGHRVPLFVRWPAQGIGGGRDIPQLAAHIDLLPTLIDLCGLPSPAGVAFDGSSLRPLLESGKADWPDRTLFVHNQRREIPPKWEHSAVMTDRWRLVNGKELYEIRNDAAEAHDVAAGHPDVVSQLRDRYETWWASLAPAIGGHVSLLVGAEQANPTTINSMDWHNDNVRDIPWNQAQVKSAPWANGYWWIEPARAGRYEFTLRLQSPEAPRALEASRARLTVGTQETSVAVPVGATAVTLALDLPAGPVKMQTWLTNEAGDKSRGAFFVEIHRVN